MRSRERTGPAGHVGPAVAASPITARSVCIGLFAAALIGLLSAYNDCYLSNTYFVSNHFPVAAIALVVTLILSVNAGAAVLFRCRGLGSGELLMIWALVGMAGSLTSYATVGYFPSFAVAPAYMATPANEYGRYLLDHIPDWLVVSKDPEDPAVRWFMEGLPRGERIPWRAWAGPLAAWLGYVLALYGSNFALCAVFFRQWSVRERLVFPIVQVPAEVAQEPPKGRVLNAFFANRLTWIGIAIPFLVWGIKGLKAYEPAIPDLPLSFSTWGLFADRPWNQFNLRNAEIFFAVVGLTFLLTREVGFSFWFFFVLYRLSFVLVAWLGAGGGTYFGNWETRVSRFDTAGGMLALAVFLCFSARRSLAAWARRVLSGRSDPEMDVLPPRLAAALILGGAAAMTGWYVLAGAQWWVGLLAVLLFLAMLLVMTRIVAESGLLFLGGITEPFRFLTNLFPASWLSGASVTVLALQRGIVTEDMRKIFMPYVINGMKAAERGRLHLGKATAVFMAVTVLALGISTYGFIATSYKYGAVNVESWASTMAPRYYLDDATKLQKNPPDFDVIEAGGVPVMPVNAAHTAFGGLLVSALLVLRAFLPWWPLHPFGFVLCATWAISRIWFSILLGWTAKFAIMSFGGARAYQRALPFFLGLALGEALIAAVWMAVGLVTGVPNMPLTA